MAYSNPHSNLLQKTVIQNGYCIGCGACAVPNESPFSITFDEHKKLQAKISQKKSDESDFPFTEVCPFSDNAQNETELATDLFNSDWQNHAKVGHYLANYAGYVSEGDFRETGSSGGFGSWILTELLGKGDITAVIHVKRNSHLGEKLFSYQISYSSKEIQDGAKSKYYPIEFSEVIRTVKNTPGRYAFVGIPCFIKAIRLLCKKDEVLRERIAFYLGLVCGHLKSARFADMLCWQMGIHPQSLEAIDFRTKLTGTSANHYGVTIKSSEKELISPPINQMFGTNWGWGLFKYKACDFCDDVVAETADITIGDAWLPKYKKEERGTNILIVRNQQIQNLLLQAQREGRIVLDKLSVDEVIQSQESGFFHRRDALAYRLYCEKEKGNWTPQKRVSPANSIQNKLRQRQDLRSALVKKSHTAFIRAIDQNSFLLFKTELKDLISAYEKLYQPNWKIRMIMKFKKFIRNQKG